MSPHPTLSEVSPQLPTDPIQTTGQSLLSMLPALYVGREPSSTSARASNTPYRSASDVQAPPSTQGQAPST